jgi:predicted SAM-dependent methyltransferase
MGGNVNTWLTFGPRTAHADALRVDILPIADVQGDIRALTFADGTFAGVEAAHVLEHLLPEEAVPAVRECWRVLRAGGIFEVAVPDLEVTCASCRTSIRHQPSRPGSIAGAIPMSA